MANQLLALQIERPRFSYPEALSNAQTLTRGNQKLEQGRMANERAGMELEDYAAESGALRDYREAARADDPNAMDKLKGFPEIQAKVHQALESMKPDELIKAKIDARAMGEAAAYVKRFQPGSPEERQAWDEVLGKLAGDGVIDEATANHWKQAGPSDLILDQADMMADLVGGYLRKPKAEGINEVDKYIDEQVEKLRDDLISDDFTPGPDQMAQIEERLDAFRRELEQKYPKSGGRRGIGERIGGGGKGDALIEDAGAFDPEAGTGKDVGRPLKGEGVAADNAKQVPLKRPRAVNPQTGETLEYDAGAGAWVPVTQ